MYTLIKSLKAVGAFSLLLFLSGNIRWSKEKTEVLLCRRQMDIISVLLFSPAETPGMNNCCPLGTGPPFSAAISGYWGPGLATRMLIMRSEW